MQSPVDDVRIRLLGGTALFGSLSTEDLASIGHYLRPVAFKPNQLIFSRGDEGRDIYFVTEGRVRLSILSSDGRELSLNHAAAGDFFGEIAALDGAMRSADATALGTTKGYSLPQSALKILLETNPRVAAAAIHFLCRRIRDTNEKLEAIALHPIEVRIARFLLTAIKFQKIVVKDGKAVVDLAMSQGELALLVGASRPKVNIALTLLEERGAIERDAMRITCMIDVLDELAIGEG